MNHKTKHLARALVMTAVVAVATGLAGCGRDVGPSSDDARIDLLHQLNRNYDGVLKTDTFEISDRKQLSETRVQLHVIASYTLNADRAHAMEQSQRMIGYQNSALEKARANDGKKQELTLLYRRQGDENWRLTRITPGYQ